MRFDVVIVSDFRFPGGTSACIAHEIRALSDAGYSVGLVPMRAPLLKRDRPMNPAIQACVDRGEAAIADVDGDVVGARLAVLHNPFVFVDRPPRPLKIRAAHKVLVVHQPILDRSGIPYFDAARVHEVAESIVGRGLVWAPISPVVRRNVDVAGVTFPLLAEDWSNIVVVDDWATERRRPLKDIPVIGRHSRPELEKWPATAQEMLTIYPADPSIEVRLLGVGDDLRQVLRDFPANWRIYRFNEVAPVEFLRTIDFFVYYHSPGWIEAFGRTIAEAAASGAVCIVPPYLEATFGEAALYREPQEVVPTVRALHADWKRYRAQSRLGRETIARRFGPQAYIERVRGLIGRPGRRTRTVRVQAGQPTPQPSDLSASPLEAVFDVVILADMRSPRDASLRLAHEVRIQAAAGITTALVHLPSNAVSEPFIHPEIDACVREGLATAVDPRRGPLSAKLLVIHAPESVLDRIPDSVPEIKAERIVVVADVEPSGRYDVGQKDRLFRLFFGGSMTWAPTSDRVRQGLADSGATIDMEPGDWRPAIASAPWRDRSPRGDSPVVGCVLGDDPAQWPGQAMRLLQVYPDDGSAIVRIMGLSKITNLPVAEMPSSWERFDLGELAIGKFLDSLDFLLYCPDKVPDEIPETAIAEAMVRGVVPVLPPELAPIFGRGALYRAGDEVQGLVKGLHGDRERYVELARQVARHARNAFGESGHLGRVAHLLGRPVPKLGAMPSNASRRLLFLSSNGVGLGHLTRLLAVARRLPNDIEPVFATMSQAVEVVKGLGFAVEYIPFHLYADCNLVDWNHWLTDQIEQMVDFYGVAGVVFDGSNPYFGVLRAIAPRPDLSFVWIRRAMWRARQPNQPLIERQRYFDLIIEPGEMAERRDSGLTVQHRGRSVCVDPIRFLDPEELLDRETAAAALGLDPGRPAVLVQLGAGATSNVVPMCDAVVVS
ncbi:MAG: hypothetical protein WD230_05730, partial [Cucumibacter sp.]